jgi:hypothetical protein
MGSGSADLPADLPAAPTPFDDNFDPESNRITSLPTKQKSTKNWPLLCIFRGVQPLTVEVKLAPPVSLPYFRVFGFSDSEARFSISEGSDDHKEPICCAKPPYPVNATGSVPSRVKQCTWEVRGNQLNMNTSSTTQKKIFFWLERQLGVVFFEKDFQPSTPWSWTGLQCIPPLDRRLALCSFPTDQQPLQQAKITQKMDEPSDLGIMDEEYKAVLRSQFESFEEIDVESAHSAALDLEGPVLEDDYFTTSKDRVDEGDQSRDETHCGGLDVHLTRTLYQQGFHLCFESETTDRFRGFLWPCLEGDVNNTILQDSWIQDSWGDEADSPEQTPTELQDSDDVGVDSWEDITCEELCENKQDEKSSQKQLNKKPQQVDHVAPVFQTTYYADGPESCLPSFTRMLEERSKKKAGCGYTAALSEALSFKVLQELFGARLVCTEMEVQYHKATTKIDFTAQIYGQIVGVSVTRAFSRHSCFRRSDASRLIRKKLEGLSRSLETALSEHRWSHSLLHVWVSNHKDRTLVVEEFNHIMRSSAGPDSNLLTKSPVALFISVADFDGVPLEFTYIFGSY